METFLRATVLFVTYTAFAACSTPTSAGGANLPSGRWAGEHVVMEVTDAGATVEFDCAHGTIDGPLTVDSTGRFDAAGSFTRESGGPTRENQPRAVPARYSGSLKDSTLTMALVLTESKETVGTFTLTHGAQARLFKCK